jgi:hypothetical protein
MMNFAQNGRPFKSFCQGENAKWRRRHTTGNQFMKLWPEGCVTCHLMIDTDTGTRINANCTHHFVTSKWEKFYANSWGSIAAKIAGKCNRPCLCLLLQIFIHYFCPFSGTSHRIIGLRSFLLQNRVLFSTIF